MGLYLYHGTDFLVLEELKKIKSKFGVFLEFWGFDNQDVNLNEYLNSYSIFEEKKIIIIREILENNKLSTLVEDLLSNLKSNKDLISNNDIYLFQYGLISSNLKIYKFIQDLGEIIELKKPTTASIKNNIKKKLKISEEAINYLLSKTSENLFAIKNEISKLKQVDLSYITHKEVELYVIDLVDNNNIWGIGDDFIEFILNPNLFNFKKVSKNVDNLINRDVEEMFILNVFYNSLFRLINLIQSYKEKKTTKDIIALVGYLFFKKYSNNLNKKIDILKLLEINKILLFFEYRFKNGIITNPDLGIKLAIIKIYLFLKE